MEGMNRDYNVLEYVASVILTLDIFHVFSIVLRFGPVTYNDLVERLDLFEMPNLL